MTTLTKRPDQERAERLAWGAVGVLSVMHAGDYEIVRERLQTLRGIADGNKASTARVKRIAVEAIRLAEAQTRIAYSLPTFTIRGTVEAKVRECDRMGLPYEGAAQNANLRTLDALGL